LEKKLPASFSAPADAIQRFNEVTALFQPPPRPLTMIPLTRPHRDGQLQLRVQTSVSWETDVNKQLDEPYVAPELTALLQAARMLGQMIGEHPLRTCAVCAGAGLLVYLASSRN
jgi:hypothetical protein